MTAEEGQKATNLVNRVYVALLGLIRSDHESGLLPCVRDSAVTGHSLAREMGEGDSNEGAAITRGISLFALPDRLPD